MKNYILTLIKTMGLIAMTVGLANCSKDNNSSTTPTASAYRCFQVNTYNNTSTQVDNSYCYNNTYQSGAGTAYQCRDVNNYTVSNTLCGNTTGYHITNGICYNSAGTQVSHNYCSNTAGGYVMQNGMCYQVINGQYVQSNQVNCLNGGTSGSIVNCSSGTYFYQGQTIQCGVTHLCPSGLMLQTQTGQTVTCQ